MDFSHAEDWFKLRSLDFYKIRDEFGLVARTREGRPVLNYPTACGVPRVRFLDGNKPKYTWKRAGGKPGWYGLESALELCFSKGLDTIYIVNGEPSVWACWSAGVPAVSTTTGETANMSDRQLSHLASLNYKISIVYDNDEPGRKGSYKLAQSFLDIGANVEVLKWTWVTDDDRFKMFFGEGGGRGCDVDDLHQIVGPKKLLETLKMFEAEEVILAERATPKNNSDLHLAKVLLKRVRLKNTPPLVFNGDFYRYNPSKQIWERLDFHRINRMIGEFDGMEYYIGDAPKPICIGAARMKSITYCAKSEVATEGFFEKEKHGAQFKNGFMELSDLKMRQSRPEDLQRFRIEVSYNENAKCPIWLDVLSSTFFGTFDKEQRIALVQEFAGAIIFGIIGQVLFLVGEGDNGKSSITDVLTNLVPPEVVRSIAPHKLAGANTMDYYASSLFGARLNVDADIPAAEMMQSSTWKKTVTGDTIPARDPAGMPYDFRPRVVHLFSANELPATKDHSNGFWRRIMVLRLDRDFSKDPSSGVTEAVKEILDRSEIGEFGQNVFEAEREGIIAWAVEGARRLKKNNMKFTIPISSSKKKEEWKLLSNQVEGFLKITCEEDDPERDIWTLSSDLHKAYKGWATETNHGQMSSTKFGKRMAALGYTEVLGTKRRSRSGIEYKIAMRTAFDPVPEMPY